MGVKTPEEIVGEEEGGEPNRGELVEEGEGENEDPQSGIRISWVPREQWGGDGEEARIEDELDPKERDRIITGGVLSSEEGKGTREGAMSIDPGQEGAPATKPDLTSLRTALTSESEDSTSKSEDFPVSPVRKEAMISDTSDDDTDDGRSDAGKPDGSIEPTIDGWFLETWKLFQDFGG